MDLRYFLFDAYTSLFGTTRSWNPLVLDRTTETSQPQDRLHINLSMKQLPSPYPAENDADPTQAPQVFAESTGARRASTKKPVSALSLYQSSGGCHKGTVRVGVRVRTRIRYTSRVLIALHGQRPRPHLAAPSSLLFAENRRDHGSLIHSRGILEVRPRSFVHGRQGSS